MNKISEEKKLYEKINIVNFKEEKRSTGRYGEAAYRLSNTQRILPRKLQNRAVERAVN